VHRVSKVSQTLSRLLVCAAVWTALPAVVRAQQPDTLGTTLPDPADTLLRVDSLLVDSLTARELWHRADSATAPIGRTASSPLPAPFRPNPTRAVIYSAVFPGLGQIYNRKYWKLPIVYGGFMGFVYAITWNNKNYRDYSEAYLHIMTDDVNSPSTWHQSWQNFVPRNRDPKDYISNANFRSNLKSGKDYYRRYRDLSVILTVAWYFLCMADAYVDAQLFDFDISPDLSLHLTPTVTPLTNPSSAAFGLACSIHF